MPAMVGTAETVGTYATPPSAATAGKEKQGWGRQKQQVKQQQQVNNIKGLGKSREASIGRDVNSRENISKNSRVQCYN
jgi:hypothetical protein